jgi:hypothetical protein
MSSGIVANQIPEAATIFLERLYEEELVGRFKQFRNYNYMLSPLGISKAEEALWRMELRGISTC